MFVLPAMKDPDDDFFEAANKAKMKKLTRPPPTLAPALLTLWGIPFESEFPEEGSGRTAIVREYLMGCALWIREFNASLNKVFDRAIMYAIKDETIEREFIEEDADRFAWKHFAEHTRLAAIERFVRREEEGRRVIVSAFLVSSLSYVGRLESVHRQYVALQFLESFFLKLCQWKPGWMWRRVPDVFEDGDSKPAVVLPSWLVSLEEEETMARKHIEDSFFSRILLSADVFASVEKRLTFEGHKLHFEETIATAFDRSATIIQAAYRGFRLRKLRCIQ